MCVGSSTEIVAPLFRQISGIINEFKIIRRLKKREIYYFERLYGKLQKQNAERTRGIVLRYLEVPANANSDRFSHFSHFVCLHYMPCSMRKMVVVLFLASSLVPSVAYSIVILLHEIILAGIQKG